MKTVLDVLKERIAEDIETSERHLASGKCDDYAAYKEVVGIIRGLRAATNLLVDLERNLENDDD